MTDKHYHHGDLKASLINAANTILQRDGADSLSLRAIAAEVGVSHMAPYAHFKNKQQLLESVVEAGFMNMAQAMEKSSQHLDKTNPALANELILIYGASYLNFATEHPQLYRLMLGQIDTTGRKANKPPKRTNTQPNQSHTPQHFETSQTNINRPFTLLRQAFVLKSSDSQQAKAQAIGAWAMVHGLAALITEGRINVPTDMNLKQFLSACSASFTQPH